MHCNITINTNLYNNCYHISSIFIFFLVIINYTVNRYICNKYKIPYDCIQNIKLYDKYLSLTNLFIYIILLYYLNSLKKIYKHKFITKIIFIIVTLISSFLFSYISSIEIIRGSIQTDNNNNIDINNITIILYLFLLILPIIILIINFIYNKPSFKDIFNRIFIIGWFTLWCFSIYKTNNNINIHFHHIFFSLIFCILFYQKNIIIQIIFFISLGIFIQGFSNYKYEGIITLYKNNTNLACENNIVYKNKIIKSYETDYKNVYKCEYEEDSLYYLCNDVCK